MSRRRYRWDSTVHALVEITGEEPGPSRLEIVPDSHYEGQRTQDGTDISTRRRHREYLRVHGLATADDYTNTWKQAAKEREKFYSGDFDHAGRKEDVARAVHDLKRRR